MTSRPTLRAQSYAISSGHELASLAGAGILANGGNAVDAGVAAGLALGVLHPDLVNVAGVAPIILRMAEDGKVVTIDGLGTWPRAASAEFFEKEFGGAIPEGILRTVVPAAPAAWITALRDFGTMTFAEVAAAAIQYARDGFPVYPLFADIVAANETKYQSRPTNAQIYLPNGHPPVVGENFVQTDLARTLQYMVDQERSCPGDRKAGLGAAYDAFYRGDIAKLICDYHRSHGGFLSMEDLSDYRPRYESPLKSAFAEHDFYCCGAWCQGITLAQTFAMLDADKLRSLKPNTADYIHHLTEVYKLAFADRESYVADPAFVDVPVDQMLDPAYLSARLALIDPERAYPEMPPAGAPHTGLAVHSGPRPSHSTAQQDAQAVTPQGRDLDTSHVGVIDSAGNMFAATPSDTSSDTVVIPGTGLCPSSRGSQSLGIPGHINAVAPGKRPRLTPNPALAVKDGKPFMTIGTPGGDVQIQAMTQVVANILCHGMDVQEAIEAPRFATYSYPSSFAPNTYFPGLLMLEGRIRRSVGETLGARGHKVQWWDDQTWKAGGVCAIVVNDDSAGTERLQAGADPRRANMALGA
jgi:gamma-glutamyltranspeptidase/glutathione hydrolase